MEKVPEGDWFCSVCCGAAALAERRKAQEARRAAAAARRSEHNESGGSDRAAAARRRAAAENDDEASDAEYAALFGAGNERVPPQYEALLEEALVVHNMEFFIPPRIAADLAKHTGGKKRFYFFVIKNGFCFKR